VAICPSCAAYARDWRLVYYGFRALAEEQAPEAPLGFAARLIRRLGDVRGSERAAAEFLERAGRRAVLATLLLTLTAVLALLLPSTGPLGGSAAADLALAQAEFAPAENDPIFAPDTQDNPGFAPARTPTGIARGKK
jgi:hypothetical protein